MALALDSEAGQATLRVVRLLADPLSALPEGAVTLPALLHAPEFRSLAPKALATTPAGAVLREIALATRALPDRLAPDMATGLRLALAPDAQLSKARRFLAAAIHATRLRAALLKAERDEMAALFSPEAFEFALREGAAFCHHLAQFDEGAVLTGDDFNAHPVAEVAHRLMATALMAVQPTAGHVYALRSTGALLKDLPQPDAQTVKQALRAMARGAAA